MGETQVLGHPERDAKRESKDLHFSGLRLYQSLELFSEPITRRTKTK